MLCSQLCAQMELMSQTSWNRQPDIHSRTARGSYHLCISPLSRPALNAIKPCKVPDKSLPSPVFLAGCKGGLDNETAAQEKSDMGWVVLANLLWESSLPSWGLAPMQNTASRAPVRAWQQGGGESDIGHMHLLVIHLGGTGHFALAVWRI